MHGQVPSHMPPTAPVDFSAWGLNDATAQFGMQLGQSAVAAGQDYVQKNVRLLCEFFHVCVAHYLLRCCSHLVGRSHSDYSSQEIFSRVQFICSHQTPCSTLPVET